MVLFERVAHPIVSDRNATLRGPRASASTGLRCEISDPEAVCNDGTPAVYYGRPGVGEDRDRWVIWLAGGSGCWDTAGCAARWNSSPEQMSSAGYPEEETLLGILSRDPDNPFANWTHIYVSYCSSDYHLGDREEPQPVCSKGGDCPDGLDPSDGWLFRGGRIVDGLLRDLANAPEGAPDLGRATDLVWGGGSAGSIGARSSIDHVIEEMRALDPEMSVVGLFDAEWRFVPPDAKTEDGLEDLEANMAALIAYWDGQLDESCLAATGESALCFKNWFQRDYIDTPFFVFMDQLDSNLLGSYGLDDLSDLTAEEQASVSSFAEDIRGAMRQLDAGYSPHSNGHVAGTNHERFIESDIEGASYAETLGSWYFDRSGPTLVVDESPLPWE